MTDEMMNLRAHVEIEEDQELIRGINSPARA